MAKQLLDDQVTAAKAWLHDVFVWGGLIEEPSRDITLLNYFFMYGPRNKYNHADGDKQAAQTICETIKIRKVDAKFVMKADEALKVLEQCPFNPDLHNLVQNHKVWKKADMLAKYIAWYCATYEFYWDDTSAGTYEMDEIKNHTILGKALWDASCFVSQGNAPAPGTRAASSTTPGQPPKNNFKARGPLSNSCVDLKSAPNQKEYLSGKVYAIMVVDNQGNFVQEKDYYGVYIRPVEADPKIQQKYMVNGTNKVLVGPSKGFGFCLCWFKSIEDADAFMVRCRAAGLGTGKSAVAADFRVGKEKHPSSNGYFRVGTQFGECYISAEKLNEELQEEAQPVKEEVDLAPTPEELAGCVGGLSFKEYEEAWFRG